MRNLGNLPKEKWWSANEKEPGLKPDVRDIERGILEAFELQAVPPLVRVDTTAVKVAATPDSPVGVVMCGFPNILAPGQFLRGGLTDGKYRENSANVTMDFDLAASLWGTEKPNQWYAIFALAGNTDTDFTIKGMPDMRVKSQASQVISLGTLVTPATGIGYGFSPDELVDGIIYPISGASQGLMRTITANNNDNGTGGTITYGGDALTLAQGDWFAVLPPGTNFRFLGDIFNDPGGNLRVFKRRGNISQEFASYGTNYSGGVIEDISLAPPLANRMTVRCVEDSVGYGGYLGHPDTTETTGALPIFSDSLIYGSHVTINIELCKFYMKVNSVWMKLDLIEWEY